MIRVQHGCFVEIDEYFSAKWFASCNSHFILAIGGFDSSFHIHFRVDEYFVMTSFRSLLPLMWTDLVERINNWEQCVSKYMTFTHPRKKRHQHFCYHQVFKRIVEMTRKCHEFCGGKNSWKLNTTSGIRQISAKQEHAVCIYNWFVGCCWLTTEKLRQNKKKKRATWIKAEREKNYAWISAEFVGTQSVY